jgi:hypothetical protein
VSAESQQKKKPHEDGEEEEEAVEEEENAAVSCTHCLEKEETIKKLERDLKRVKYLYYEANGKLMEGTMRDKNRERHQPSGTGSLHRSESAESAASMGSTSTTPRSRQLKETASLIFHESSSKRYHQIAHTSRVVLRSCVNADLACVALCAHSRYTANTENPRGDTRPVGVR